MLKLLLTFMGPVIKKRGPEAKIQWKFFGKLIHFSFNKQQNANFKETY